MTDIKHLTPPRIEGRICWYGTIAETPSDFAQEIHVILPEFDTKLRWGPCRWQARDATSFPERGDECLVVFDNRRVPWIVAWWPF